MKYFKSFSKHHLVIFIIVVFDLTSALLFLLNIFKTEKIMNILNFIWSNIETILVLTAIMVTIGYILYTKYSNRQYILQERLSGIEIRMKVIHAIFKGMGKESAYPEDLRELMTDEEIIQLDKYGYSEDDITKILESKPFKQIN